MNIKKILVLFCFTSFISTAQVKVGAEQFEKYLPLLKGRKVGVVANQTSIVANTHLVDTLLSQKVKIKKIYSPEHGFRGVADAGETVNSNKDLKTSLPVVSLYGKHKKPTPEDFKGIDIVLFDLQDVGVRFYTYISTLHYVMEACAENNKKLIVLDRPNPNGFYIDGPMLEEEQKSFVGMHKVPVVYGMTIGEYAQMINGEDWLTNKVKCNLQVVKLENYNHSSLYSLPVKPSPNLIDMTSIYLYPSLCFFEGTLISVGRGTEKPFQIYGHPDLKNSTFSFTPKPTTGAKEPPYKDKLCYGVDLSSKADTVLNTKKIILEWLIDAYKNSPDKEHFFNNYFNKLSGNVALKQQIIEGKSEDEIRQSWKDGIEKFKEVRAKYLLYIE